MMDQSKKFTSQGLKAEFVGEGQQDHESEKRVLMGQCQLVFITPEGILNSTRFRNMLLSTTYKEKLVAVAVDEAHCIKTWGDKFRVTFSKIGDIRSLLPSGVNIMALTTTSTNETFHVISEHLCMQSPEIIAISPARDNIFYKIQPKISLEDLTSFLCDEMSEKRLSSPKIVVVVRQYSDCSNLYLSIRSKMGPGFTEPFGYPDHSTFCMVEMFTRVSTIEKKDQILSSFQYPDGTLRLIIATTAFGLGIDCKDIRRVIHWGIPSTLEEYVQETGRAGRDNNASEAILHLGRGGRYVVKGMKQYIANDSVCRRKILFSDFLKYNDSATVIGCKCCDLCLESCDCNDCDCNDCDCNDCDC